MAKPLVYIAFHAGEPFGATLESARNESAEAVVRGAGPFPVRPEQGVGFPAILKCANALGVAVFVGASNDRLLAALAHPAERKAVFDGVSRSRFVPTPVAASSTELRLLSPLEVADELRLNFDIWRRAMFTAPIGRSPQVESRIVTKTAEPGAEIAAISAPSKGDTLLVIDFDEIARGTDPDGAVARMLVAIRAKVERKTWTLGAASGESPGSYERMLRDVFTAGTRPAVIELATAATYDAAHHGFPLELARLLAPASVAARSLASAGDALSSRPLILGALDPKVARGSLLRRLASGFGASAAFPVTERARASFTIAASLLDRLAIERPDDAVTPAEITLGLGIVASIEGAIEVAQKADRADKSIRNEDAQAHLGEAKKAKTRAVRALPKPDDAGVMPTISRGEFLTALRKACAAAVQSVGHASDALRALAAGDHAPTGSREVVRETAV